MKRMTSYKILGITTYPWQKPRRLLLFCVLTVCFQWATLPTFAQYTKLLDFGSTANGTHPYSTPISDGTFLYGMTSDGGANKLGTVYKIKLDGTGFVKLLDFDGTNGANPYGSLTFVGTTLFGMTRGGGASGNGVIFKINSDGTGYTNLLDFAGVITGAYPYGSLISDGTFLYGMTTQGGSKSYGTVFKILPDGTGYTMLLAFDYTTNGGYPYGSLISDGTYLYGMTTLDGLNDYGTIFKLKSDGTGYTKLLNFDGKNNGSSPYGSLIQVGTFLYGMTFSGGLNNNGTIFKIQPDGNGFAKLLDFSRTIHGAYPKGSLIYNGNILYGTTSQGGLKGNGTVFQINTDGLGFFKLLDSNDNSSGAISEGTLVSDGIMLYGTKSNGGPGSLGNIYKIHPDIGFSNLFSFEISGNSASGSLLLEGAFLYGMTSSGGSYNDGTVFKVMPDGTGFVKLLDFDGANGRTPNGSLFSDKTFLYGMTYTGGLNDQGTIFKIKSDGTGYAKLFDFDATTSGGYPNGSLISDGTFLYGMTSNSGPKGSGTIFKIMPDGTGFNILLSFDGINGGYPNGSLIWDGTFLYGIASGGGSIGFGTVFKIKPDGTGFVNLLDFDNTTNGSNPKGDLLYDGTFLYGMTNQGGSNNSGTIFKIKPDATSYAKLLDFNGTNKGNSPYGSLIANATFLYGMTSGGGILNSGTIFKIKPDGTGYAKLLDFNDGSNPQGSLISDGAFLYGMTRDGGANSLGTLFKRSLAPSTTITNFTPTDGVEGTYVTINGIDFDPTPANNIVTFNGTTATVTSSSESTLTAFVPAGATTGPISVTAFGTGTSATDFVVIFKAIMVNGIVQNCNVPFLPPTSTYIQNNGYKDVIETFLPVNPSDKVKVSFSLFNAGDSLYVYDGPTTASPLLAALSGTTLPADIIAKGAGGELTFRYRWLDNGAIWAATISCQNISTLQTCNFQFFDRGGAGGNYPSNEYVIQTFSPANAGDKIKASFLSFAVEDGSDFLYVYDGPSINSPLVATLTGNILPANITATGAGGELTFLFQSDSDIEDIGWEVTISCQSTGGPTITVATQPSASSVCIGTNTTFTTAATGTTNITYQWQFASTLTGAYTDIVNGGGYSNATTSTLSINTTGNFGAGFYQCKINGDLVSTIFTNVAQLTINVTTSPTTTGANLCNGTSTVLNASGGTNGQYLWYTTASGGTVIPGEVNNTYTTPVLATTSSYYVSLTVGGCESVRTAVTATVITPAIPTVVGASACPASTFTLTASGGTNGQYKWYTVASGGTAIASEVNSTYTTPSLTSTTDYFVSLTTGGCESARTKVTATIVTAGCAPAIAPDKQSTGVEGKVEFDLSKLITTTGTLDPASIKVITQPKSGAVATISNGVLTIDYKGISFSGNESIVIEACNTNGLCSQQTFNIEVSGEVVVYNAVSPEGKNPILRLQYIDGLSPKNQVSIYNRWGDEVFSISDYDNKTRVFAGLTNDGGKLPAGTYFYKIVLPAMGKTMTGFLALKY
jgi:uncharacterized repeat protein (TIGR03803 family)